jgi:hypothetical protein
MEQDKKASGWGDWRLPVILLFLAVVVAVAALFAHNALTSKTPWINHDVAFHSYLGFELLHGSRLYVDIKDSNPPGAQFLLGGLIGLADLLGLPDFLINHLFVLAIGVAGLFVLRMTLREPQDALPFVLSALAYLLVVVRGNFSNNLFATAPQIPYDFGQREHLFSLLFFPYVVLRITGRKPAAAAWPWLAGVGFVSMFKPYWPLMVGMVEVFSWTRRERRLPSTAAALALGMLLPFAVLLLHSVDSFVQFFTVLLPLHAAGGYTHYDTTYSGFFKSSLHVQIVVGVVIFLACSLWAWTRSRLQRADIVLMAAIVAGCYLSMVHQHKFWSYHAMTLFASVALFSALAISAAAIRLDSGRAEKSIAIGVMVVLLLLGAAGIANLQRMLERSPPPGDHMVQLIEGREKVMFFSMSADYTYAPLLLRMPSVGAWTAHFELPALLDIPDPAARDRELGSYAAALTKEIDEQLPEMLLFAPSRQALPPGEVLHEILRRHGVVPRSDYRRIPEVVLQARDPRLQGWIVYSRERVP